MAGDVLILDTCALLWLAGQDRLLSVDARRRIADAAVVWVSAITGFEIGVKVRKRKLDLPLPVEVWLASVVDHHRLAVAPLDLSVCVRATQLPPVHWDPADRMIIATALGRRCPVVTSDSTFAQYGVETFC
jgi:PIN domain nuclease of toxin-antitoxin system